MIHPEVARMLAQEEADKVAFSNKVHAETQAKIQQLEDENAALRRELQDSQEKVKRLASVLRWADECLGMGTSPKDYLGSVCNTVISREWRQAGFEDCELDLTLDRDVLVFAAPDTEAEKRVD